MKRSKMTRIISFRVTEEDWLEIERAAADCGDKPHDWCRTLALETLQTPVGLTPNQWILFSQMARVGWLVESGFQLFAEDTLESEHWKRYRAYARENLAVITDRALEEFQSRTHLDQRESASSR